MTITICITSLLVKVGFFCDRSCAQFFFIKQRDILYEKLGIFETNDGKIEFFFVKLEINWQRST